MMGMAMVEVAVFEVISVRKITSSAVNAISTNTGTASSAPTAPPIQVAKPDWSIARASERPPPNRTSTPQGILRAVSQSSANTPRFQLTGRKNSNSAAPIAIVESVTNGVSVSRPGIVTSPNVFSPRITHASAVSVNTTAVTRSPELIGPSPLRCSAMMASASPDSLPGL